MPLQETRTQPPTIQANRGSFVSHVLIPEPLISKPVKTVTTRIWLEVVYRTIEAKNKWLIAPSSDPTRWNSI